MKVLIPIALFLGVLVTSAAFAEEGAPSTLVVASDPAPSPTPAAPPSGAQQATVSVFKDPSLGGISVGASVLRKSISGSTVRYEQTGLDLSLTTPTLVTDGSCGLLTELLSSSSTFEFVGSSPTDLGLPENYKVRLVQSAKMKFSQSVEQTCPGNENTCCVLSAPVLNQPLIFEVGP